MQEVFIVGTAAEVTPINQIGDVHYQVGEVTRDSADAVPQPRARRVRPADTRGASGFEGA